MSRICNSGPKKLVPRNRCSLMNHIQAKQPPLWPVGRVHVGLFTLRGKARGRARHDLITPAKQRVCMCSRDSLASWPWFCRPSSSQLLFYKHAMPFSMWPLVSNKAVINNWSVSGFGISEGEVGEGDKWRNCRSQESSSGKLEMAVFTNESSNKSH